mmetsp:Transcript_47947/g.113984  ORF Transcript_47947/g.113984 Transcript_47947/m.113984 type:complete len:585 (+) Transcript_47947:86-1840(+)
MAPAHSKGAPTDVASANVALSKKVQPIVTTILELLQACVDGSCAVIDGAFKRVTAAVDSAVRGAIRWSQSCCFGMGLPGSGEPLLGALPKLFALQIMVMLYNAFVFVYLPGAGLALSSTPSLLFHAFFIMTLASFTQASRTDPGAVPNSRRWQTYGRPPPELRETKRGGGGEARWCRKSDTYKPDRAHYCSALQRCVLRMDHYCPWIGNAVGFANHKYFLLLLLYSVSSCVMLSSSSIHLLLQATLPALSAFVLGGATGIAALLASVLIPLLLFHCWLLGTNMTTIEFCEQWNRDKGEPQEGEVDDDDDDAESKKKQDRGPSIYDVGVWQNISAVMGRNPCLWLLPVGGPEGDGLRFPRQDLPRNPMEVMDTNDFIGGSSIHTEPPCSDGVGPESTTATLFEDFHAGCCLLTKASSDMIGHLATLCSSPQEGKTRAFPQRRSTFASSDAPSDRCRSRTACRRASKAPQSTPDAQTRLSKQGTETLPEKDVKPSARPAKCKDIGHAQQAADLKRERPLRQRGPVASSSSSCSRPSLAGVARTKDLQDRPRRSRNLDENSNSERGSISSAALSTAPSLATTWFMSR